MNFIKLSGQVAPGFELMAEVLANQIQKNGGGSALSIYYKGEPVVDIWGGVRNRHGDKWEARTTSVSYSTTKGVLSTLLHLILEEERLDYDLKVASIWPEFRAQGKKDICIRDLLTHEAGLFNIRGLIDEAGRMLDWGYMCDRLAGAVPELVGKHAYHGLTYGWLVGEVIRRLSGKLPGDLLNSDFMAPLALTGAFIGVPKYRLPHVAELMTSHPPDQAREEKAKRRFHAKKWVKKGARRAGNSFVSLVSNVDRIKDTLLPHGMKYFKFDHPEVLQAQIPAANGVFDARSLAKLYSVLAMKGELADKRYLSESRVLTLSAQRNSGLDAVIPAPMGWRLGYHRVLNGKKSVPSGIAHYGYGGSGAWADLETGISLGFIVNSGRGTPFGDFRIWEINHALFKIIFSKDFSR